ncbi:MAG: PH domain-containing protein [Elusimicrobia bacterium]|nr:PH domain-containing protein [Elusimicrobiota bacterium]
MTSPRKETLLWRGRPSFWNWWFELLISTALFLLSGGLLADDRLSVAAVCLFCGCAAAAAAACKRLARAYAVTSERVRVQNGFFARTLSEVDFPHVRGVEVEQSFWQRMSGMGDIRVSSTAAEGAGVVFSGVSDPMAVKEILRRARLEYDKTPA